MLLDILMLCLMPIFLFVIFTFHEFGHYVVAKSLGAKIEGFTVGFGKILYTRTLKSGARFTFCRIPLLGRVIINNTSFDKLSLFKRIMVLLAGPAFNVILAFLVMFPAYVLIGLPSQPPVLTAVKVGQVADQAGLKYDDRIIAVNGAPVIRYDQVADKVSQTPPSELMLTIKRGDELFDVPIIPFEDTFVDVRGVSRQHGVLGVIANHVPIKLKRIVSINGDDVNDIENIRALVIKYFDQDITLAIETSDNRDSHYKTRIYSKHNQHLFDEDHKRYKLFYLGSIKNNFYERLSIWDGFLSAGRLTRSMVLDIARIPAQIFPVDGSKLKPETIVYDDDLVVRNFIFRVAFFVGIISIFIGFINLVPLPHFDGGQILLLIAQKFVKTPLTRKQRAKIIVTALISIYVAIMVANINKISLYADAKIEIAQEWIEDL